MQTTRSPLNDSQEVLKTTGFSRNSMSYPMDIGKWEAGRQEYNCLAKPNYQRMFVF